jgi:hypothetical protein
MKKLLLATAMACALAAPANANIVLFGAGDILDAFVDVGASGFGNVNRALTLQGQGNATIEFGARGFGNILVDGAISGADKGGTPTLGSLGWDTGFNVGIGFNSNQTGNTGITLDAMRLTIWGLDSTPLGSFSLAGPIDFSAALLALQQGNGNAVFDFELDAAQRAEFNTIRAMAGSANFTVGLSAILGCGTAGAQTFNSATCMPSNDGADSFVFFSQTAVAAVPGPIAGAGIPGLIAAGFMLLGLNKRRKQRQPVA